MLLLCVAVWFVKEDCALGNQKKEKKKQTWFQNARVLKPKAHFCCDAPRLTRCHLRLTEHCSCTATVGLRKQWYDKKYQPFKLMPTQTFTVEIGRNIRPNLQVASFFAWQPRGTVLLSCNSLWEKPGKVECRFFSWCVLRSSELVRRCGL